jgi:Tol biopolymer transport system component
MGEPDVERQLYSFDVGRGKTTRMQGTAGLFSPRWSPNGRYVVAMRADFNGMSVWDARQPGWRPLFTHDIDNPFWSLDGEWIYFNAHYDENLWRARVRDGKVEMVLPNPMRADYTPCFANGFKPDGRVLVSCNDSRRNIYAVELK